MPHPLTVRNYAPTDKGQAGSDAPTAEERAQQSEISDFLEDLKELGIGGGKEEQAGTGIV